jgi:hypothetical protein
MGAEIVKLAQVFRDAAIAKETSGGGRQDRRLYARMAKAYHQLQASGDAGQRTLYELLADPSPSVRSWIATALLVEGDASVRGALEELRTAARPIGSNAAKVLELYDRGELGHPFPKEET